MQQKFFGSYIICRKCFFFTDGKTYTIKTVCATFLSILDLHVRLYYRFKDAFYDLFCLFLLSSLLFGFLPVFNFSLFLASLFLFSSERAGSGFVFRDKSGLFTPKKLLIKSFVCTKICFKRWNSMFNLNL